MDPGAPQSVLVTGATGFIGGRLASRLIDHHHTVFCLTRAGSHTDSLRTAGARLLTGNVMDSRSLQAALAESQATMVFHLAGLVRARRSSDFMSVNADGADNLAAACARCARPPILIMVSSLAAAGPSPADSPRTESDAPTPVSNYGRSKLAGEHAAAKYAAVVPTTIVRPPVVFGPGDRAVLQMFRSISRFNTHLVPGSRAEGVRDTRIAAISVDDLVNALLLAAAVGERLPVPTSASHAAGQGIYFAAGDEQPTYADFGLAIAAALGRKPPTIIRIPRSLLTLAGIGGDMVGLIRRSPGWISRDKVREALAGSWTCSSTKVRQGLGWSPVGTLPDQLRDTALWYRDSGWL